MTRQEIINELQMAIRNLKAANPDPSLMFYDRYVAIIRLFEHLKDALSREGRIDETVDETLSETINRAILLLEGQSTTFMSGKPSQHDIHYWNSIAPILTQQLLHDINGLLSPHNKVHDQKSKLAQTISNNNNNNNNNNQTHNGTVDKVDFFSNAKKEKTEKTHFFSTHLFSKKPAKHTIAQQDSDEAQDSISAKRLVDLADEEAPVAVENAVNLFIILCANMGMRHRDSDVHVNDAVKAADIEKAIGAFLHQTHLDKKSTKLIRTLDKAMRDDNHLPWLSGDKNPELLMPMIINFLKQPDRFGLDFQFLLDLQLHHVIFNAQREVLKAVFELFNDYYHISELNTDKMPSDIKNALCTFMGIHTQDKVVQDAVLRCLYRAMMPHNDKNKFLVEKEIAQAIQEDAMKNISPSDSKTFNTLRSFLISENALADEYRYHSLENAKEIVSILCLKVMHHLHNSINLKLKKSVDVKKLVSAVADGDVVNEQILTLLYEAKVAPRPGEIRKYHVVEPETSLDAKKLPWILGDENPETLLPMIIVFLKQPYRFGFVMDKSMDQEDLFNHYNEVLQSVFNIYMFNRAAYMKPDDIFGAKGRMTYNMREAICMFIGINTKNTELKNMALTCLYRGFLSHENKNNFLDENTYTRYLEALSNSEIANTLGMAMITRMNPLSLTGSSVSSGSITPSTSSALSSPTGRESYTKPKQTLPPGELNIAVDNALELFKKLCVLAQPIIHDQKHQFGMGTSFVPVNGAIDLYLHKTHLGEEPKTSFFHSGAVKKLDSVLDKESRLPWLTQHEQPEILVPLIITFLKEPKRFGLLLPSDEQKLIVLKSLFNMFRVAKGSHQDNILNLISDDMRETICSFVGIYDADRQMQRETIQHLYHICLPGNSPEGHWSRDDLSELLILTTRNAYEHTHFAPLRSLAVHAQAVSETAKYQAGF